MAKSREILQEIAFFCEFSRFFGVYLIAMVIYRVEITICRTGFEMRMNLRDAQTGLKGTVPEILVPRVLRGNAPSATIKIVATDRER